MEKVRLINSYVDFVCCKNSNNYTIYGVLSFLLSTCPPPKEGKIPYLGEVGTEEFLMKLTSQITEMVSAKISQGKSNLWTTISNKTPEIAIQVTVYRIFFS